MRLKKVKHVMRLKGKACHEVKDQAFHEVKKVKHVMRSKDKACHEVKDQACAGTQNTILLLTESGIEPGISCMQLT